MTVSSCFVDLALPEKHLAIRKGKGGEEAGAISCGRRVQQRTCFRMLENSKSIQSNLAIVRNAGNFKKL
jgi:hypothetical protein